MSEQGLKNKARAFSEAAEKALAAADVSEMYTIVKEVQKENGDLVSLIEVLTKHYSGSKDTPRYQPQSDDAVAAMRDVALAAIDLCKQSLERT